MFFHKLIPDEVKGHLYYINHPWLYIVEDHDMQGGHEIVTNFNKIPSIIFLS